MDEVFIKKALLNIEQEEAFKEDDDILFENKRLIPEGLEIPFYQDEDVSQLNSLRKELLKEVTKKSSYIGESVNKKEF